MSLEKHRHEALRWLTQGRSDIKAARASLAAGSFEWACFQAQQAGEKALKAAWYHHSLDPWGHSLVRLIRDTPVEPLRSALEPLMPHAKKLDKLYIPTRYPNGLPDLTPAEVFDQQDANEALDAVEAIFVAVDALVRDDA